MNNDLVSRRWLLDEYDKRHEGPPGGARKIIEEAPAEYRLVKLSQAGAIDLRDVENTRTLYVACGFKITLEQAWGQVLARVKGALQKDIDRHIICKATEGANGTVMTEAEIWIAERMTDNG